jgi:hypothetical protein
MLACRNYARITHVKRGGKRHCHWHVGRAALAEQAECDGKQRCIARVRMARGKINYYATVLLCNGVKRGMDSSDGRKRCTHLLPLLPAGSNKISHAGWVLYKKQNKGSGLSKQVPPAHNGCIQRTIKNYGYSVLQADNGGSCAPPGTGTPTCVFPQHPNGSRCTAAPAPPASASK